MPARKPSKTRLKNQPAHPLEGAKAPAFRLADASGKSLALGDLLSRGSLVLYFYPRDMTPGCTTEACSFRDDIKAIRALGAEVAGVSGDSVASHQKFIAAHSLNFPLLSDPGNAIARAYRVYKKKSLYGREYMGVERTTFLIDRKGMVRKAFAKVKVNGHSAAVIEALKELG